MQACKLIGVQCAGMKYCIILCFLLLLLAPSASAGRACLLYANVTYVPLSALQSDSEYMSGQLSAFGYAITEEPEGADLWLINT